MANLKARLLGSFIGDALLHDGEVVATKRYGAFLDITVSVPAGGQLGQAGDKIQVFLPEVGARTYSPFALDRASRRFRILVLDRGESPASRWAQGLREGSPLRYIGPQSSLALSSLSTPVVLFGDETSLGVARALRDARGSRAAVLLEVSDPEAVREAVQALGLPFDCLIAASPSGAHLPELARRLSVAATASGSIALTGCARSIQALRKELAKLPGAPALKTKAYWAHGKVGLD